MIVRTETQSQYQIDIKNKKIRRLSGLKDPTARQGKDGEWKSFAHLEGLEVGKSLIIVWDADLSLTDNVGQCMFRTTMTSPLVEIKPYEIES